MIDAEQYNRINTIFKAVLELRPDERPSYISQVCEGDESLMKEVQALLASDEQEYAILNLPAFELAAPLLASDQPELPEGERLGHYRIISLLGAGGMGQVYLAEDTRLNRKVALKLLPQSYTNDASRLRRFQQEARAASALNHPNILTIYDIWEIENRHIIVTEYIEGETLRQRMKREKLSIKEAIEISIQVASALWAAHQAGIIHRDIKPENVMLRRDGLIKVLDFGLAKLVEIKGVEAKAEGTTNLEGLPTPDSSAEERSNRLHTETGLLMGTLPYMSPEQLQGEPVDPRTDIYSLGVVIYEMVAGRLPFEGETNSELADSILQGNPLPLHPELAEQSSQLWQIIEKALQKKREERYQTSGELLTDLKSLKQELELRHSSRPFVGWVKQHKAVAVILLIAAVAATFFALNRILRQRAVPFQNPKISKLTSYGKTKNAVISPDGKHVAYERLDDRKVSLWLREVGTTEERQLVPPEGVRGFGRITFSPDSQTIYYSVASANQGSGVYQVSVEGGPAVKMPIRADRNFSPDGKRIAYFRFDTFTGVTLILVANADGTGEREIARRQAPNYFSSSYISWSPDGKLLACIGTIASDGYSSVVTLDPENGTEKRITRQIWNSITEAIWLPDMSGLIIAAADETSLNQQLWHISYPSGEARRITNDLNNYSGISMSADGNSLVATQDETQFRLWTVPVGFNGSTKEAGTRFSVDMNQAKPIAALSNARLGFCWTPDGRIIFPSLENGYMDLWIMDADGNNRKQLTHNPDIEREPWVSLDGRYIVFWSYREGREHIWRVNLDGSNLTQLTNGSVERHPVCSPDGKWVYYNSWETGKATTWRISIEGGEPEQVVDTTSFSPILSPDGSLIASMNGAAAINIIPTTGGQPTKTFKNLPGYGLFQWTSDGSALTFLGRSSSGSDGIYLLPLDSGQPQQLIDFKTESMWYYRWSPDWKQLAFARATETVNTVLIRNAQ